MEIADPVSGAGIAINEIQDVVIDTGYSADQRKGWVKKVLTELARRQLRYPSEDRARLIDVLKNIVNENQRRSPIVDDVL